MKTKKLQKQSREIKVRFISQSHLIIGLDRQKSVFDEYRIANTESWDNLSDNDLDEMVGRVKV